MTEIPMLVLLCTVIALMSVGFVVYYRERRQHSDEIFDMRARQAQNILDMVRDIRQRNQSTIDWYHGKLTEVLEALDSGSRRQVERRCHISLIRGEQGSTLCLADAELPEVKL